jgi:putative acetyltransferase
MSVAIAIETPLQDDVRRLVAALNEAIVAQAPETPSEYVFNLSVEDMADPQTTVWVARIDGQAVGCGALRREAGGYGEVKRMYVDPAARGRRVAALILERIEAAAAAEGLSSLALETDKDFAAARRVYERAGYSLCPAFGDYPDNPYSVFYAKTLSRKTAA